MPPLLALVCFIEGRVVATIPLGRTLTTIAQPALLSPSPTQSTRWRTYDDGRTVKLPGDFDCWHNPHNACGKAGAHTFCPIGRRYDFALAA